MELFKRYVAASSMGVVALVCVLVGLLGVTVLRPPTHQVSSVVSSTDLIMTRGNVLSIVKDDVTVTATSKSGAPVTLSIGTTQDVKGWIGDAAYTEVIGVESDRTKLKAESHDAIGPSRVPSPTPTQPGAQSGAQSGVQSGAQPLAEPSSADLVQQLASSDMWFKQASGEGTVSLDLENVPSGRSALAASAAGPDDLTLTLTWKGEQTNTLAIIAFLAACVFALIALALFLTRWQLLRLRKIREARIEERRKADSLERLPRLPRRPSRHPSRQRPTSRPWKSRSNVRLTPTSSPQTTLPRGAPPPSRPARTRPRTTKLPSQKLTRPWLRTVPRPSLPMRPLWSPPRPRTRTPSRHSLLLTPPRSTSRTR